MRNQKLTARQSEIVEAVKLVPGATTAQINSFVRSDANPSKVDHNHLFRLQRRGLIRGEYAKEGGHVTKKWYTSAEG